jgi:putative transposase
MSFPPEIIRHAIWLYARFTLSFRDVGELLAERGIDASYETVRWWFLKFGRIITRKLRRGRPRYERSIANSTSLPSALARPKVF